MKETSENKKHSFDPIINQNSKVLILGSMPGEESLAKNEYYANPRNEFWTITSAVIGIELSGTYEEKKKNLLENGIALWDVMKTCERKGSLDSDIKNPEVNDFREFLDTYRHIVAIAFNGGKAYDTFKSKVGFKFFDERKITYIKMPSTSSMKGKHVKNITDKIKEWSEIVKYIK
ncbi:MAG: DNA-deoxyinosine glycosylase [Clostridiales bacterium GWD2_32_59]|nr:MAG: DNA-deoxyinosine glycosylase [Clostridiales bacterium GWD2_32_59]